MIEELIISDLHNTKRKLSEVDISFWNEIFIRICSRIPETNCINYKPIVVSTMNRDVHVVKTGSTNYVIIDENLAWTLDDFNRVLFTSENPEDSLPFIFRALGEGFRVSGAIELAAACGSYYLNYEQKYNSYTRNTDQDSDIYRSFTTQTQMNFILCHELQHDIVEKRLTLENDLRTIKSLIINEIIPDRIKRENLNGEHNNIYSDAFFATSKENWPDRQKTIFSDHQDYALKTTTERYQKRWLALSERREFLVECLCDIEAATIIVKSLAEMNPDHESFAIQACIGAMRHLSILATCNYQVSIFMHVWESIKEQRKLDEDELPTDLTPDFQDELNLRLQILCHFLFNKTMLKDLAAYFELKDQVAQDETKCHIFFLLQLNGVINYLVNAILPKAIETRDKMQADPIFKHLITHNVDSFLTDEIPS